MAEQLPLPFARPPRTIDLPVSFNGSATGKMSVSLVHTRALKPPDDPPPPGMAEAVWVELFHELAEILRIAWAALREAVRMLLSVRRHA